MATSFGTPRGIFAYGFEDFGETLKEVSRLGAVIENYGKTTAYLADDGSGWLSENGARALVGFIKGRILEGNTEFDTGYGGRYLKAKRNTYGHQVHMLTGENNKSSLFNSIKVLNRRYGGSKRGVIAGVSQKETTVRMVVRGGEIRPNWKGQKVKVAQYTAAVEYGLHGGNKRPVITLAITDFLSKYIPKMTKRMQQEVFAHYMAQAESKTKVASRNKGEMKFDSTWIKLMKESGYTAAQIEEFKKSWSN